MSLISDIISSQVSSAAGNLQIPSNLKNQVLSGLSSSILGGLTQTAATPGGLDAVKNLLTGKAAAATSPVTALATNLFTNNVLKKTNLAPALGASLTALIPSVLGGTKGFIRDQDGDGDVDLNDIILSLTGGGNKKSSPLGGLGTVAAAAAATSVLGGLFKKK